MYLHVALDARRFSLATATASSRMAFCVCPRPTSGSCDAPRLQPYPLAPHTFSSALASLALEPRATWAN